jgi:hypothetical protein
MYPSAIDTVESLLVARNSWATITTGAIDAVATTVPVATTFGLQATDGVVAIDNEVIAYASVNANTLIGCTRGFDGTIAASHNAGAAVELQIVAAHHNRLAAAILAVEGALGLNPQGAFASVAAALAAMVPFVHQVTVPSTNWSFSHTTGRLLSIQCYEYLGSPSFLYRKIPDAQVSVYQELVAPPTPANVTITLLNSGVGYVIAR